MHSATSVDLAFADVPAGARVFSAPCCGTPETLLGRLGLHAVRQGRPCTTLSAGLLLGELPFEPALRSGALRFRTWHVFGRGRQLAEEGLVEYLPMRAADVISHALTDVDVAIIRTTPPDRWGRCSLGPSATYGRDLVDSARLVIAEVDPTLPRTTGDVELDAACIDRFVVAEQPTCTFSGTKRGDPTLAMVAEHAATLVPDGATLQLGIGAVGDALAAALHQRSATAQFGLVGLITEAMIPLAEACLTSRRGPIQAIELMGGPELMQWADTNRGVDMVSSRRLHDPRFLAKLTRFVSINSALSVDLLGQVVSDRVGGRVIGGIGGSADFFEGAHLSPGGRRIIALPSTGPSGQSTIVASHQPNDTIAIACHSVDAVVTEHGIAELTGRSLTQRRDAMIAIADPRHRGSLDGARASIGVGA